MHKVISNLPIIIVTYWLLCAICFVKLDFYIENFEIFDFIDTLIVSLSILHFLFRYTHYSRLKRKYLICIVAIICLNLCYKLLNHEAYYFIYFTIIFATILNTIWRKINRCQTR